MKFNVQKPTENFTGREEFLKLLHKTIQDKSFHKLGRSTPAINIQSRPLLNVIAVTGIPGIGKTETVLKYIERHYGQDYDSVLWIDFNFQSERNFIAKAAFQSLAKELNIPEEHDGKQFQKKDLALIIKEVYKELFRNGSETLIVFDIVEDTRSVSVAVRGSFNGLVTTNVNQSQLRSIQAFLPNPVPDIGCKSAPPTVLITSRSQKLMWALSMQIRHISLTEIELHPWTDKECVPFLIKNLQLSKSLAIIADNKSTLLKLAAILGQLPMGLQSASSIILENFKAKDSKGDVQINRDEFKYRMVKELIGDFEAECNANNNSTVSGNFHLLPEKNEFNPDILSALLKIALEKILEAPKGNLAVQILNFIAYLSPLAISTDFLMQLVKNFCDCRLNCQCVETALNLLVGFSVIKSYGTYFSIHQSIQNFVIENGMRKTRASLRTELRSSGNGADAGISANFESDAAGGTCLEIGAGTTDTDGAVAGAGVEDAAGTCFKISARPQPHVVDVDGGNFQIGAGAGAGAGSRAGSGIVSSKPKICNLNETSVSRHLLAQLEKYVLHILNLSSTDFTAKIISPKEFHESQILANFIHVTNSLNDKAHIKRSIVLTACVKLLILAHQTETKIELYSKLLVLTKKEFSPDHDIPLGFEAQLVKALQTQRKSELRKSRSLKHHSLKRQTSFGLCSILQAQEELKNTLYTIKCNIQDYERKQVEVVDDSRQHYTSMTIKITPYLKVFFKEVTIFKNGNLATSLLSCMAFLLPKPSVIPQEFLVALFKDEGADASDSVKVVKDVTCIKGALSLLVDYHLIEFANNDGKHFKISRILQDAVKEIIKIQDGNHRKVLFNLSQKIANYLNLRDGEVEDVKISANIDHVTEQLTF